MQAERSSVWQDVALGASSVSSLPGLSEDHAREVQRLVIGGKHDGVRAKRNRFGKTVVAVPVVLPPPLPAAITGATATFFLDLAFPHSGGTAEGLGVHVDVVGTEGELCDRLSAEASSKAEEAVAALCAAAHQAASSLEDVVAQVLAVVARSVVTAGCGAAADTKSKRKVFGCVSIGPPDLSQMLPGQKKFLLVDLPREVVTVALSWLAASELINFSHSCWTAYATVETNCEFTWEERCRQLWSQLFFVDGKLLAPVPKPCAWSWRWSHAALSTSWYWWSSCTEVLPFEDRYDDEFGDIRPMPCAAIEKAEKRIGRARVVDPYIDEKIELGSWLCLYFHSTNPVVRQWAHIQANAVAGQGNVALKLLASFPFDSVGPKMAAALAIPVTDEAQAAFSRNLELKTLGMRSDDEHDVALSGKRFEAVIHNAVEKVAQRPRKHN